MRISWVPLLALTAAAPAASALEVVHQPASCSTADAYLRIAARGVPAEGSRRARSVSGSTPATRGTSCGWRRRTVEWTAALPRPQPTLKRFEYQVALTGPDAQAATTGPATVEVRADCPLPGAAVADADRSCRCRRARPSSRRCPRASARWASPGRPVAKKSHTGLKILGGVAVARRRRGRRRRGRLDRRTPRPRRPQARRSPSTASRPQPGTTLDAASTA